MYTDSGYLNNKRADVEDHSRPLIVESCGTYHLRTQPSINTHRPNGRKDYQLLYLASGKAHFFLGIKKRCLRQDIWCSTARVYPSVIAFIPKIKRKFTGCILPEVMWNRF